MNTLECARHLSRSNKLDAAIQLYEAYISEISGTSELVNVNILLNTVHEAGKRFPGEKIQQIKFVREKTNIGFKEAKDVVEVILWSYRSF